VTASRCVHCCLSFKLLRSIWPSNRYLKLLNRCTELEMKTLPSFYIFTPPFFRSLLPDPSHSSLFLFYASFFTPSFLFYLPFILHYFYVTSSSCSPAFFYLHPYLFTTNPSLSLFPSLFSSLHFLFSLFL
jgi:hypothetical protein